MYRTFRLYGETIETWTDGNGRITQKEIEYKEYETETCQLVYIGSEDFSRERLNKTLKRGWIFTWDGERRNKGGFRWFERRNYIVFNRNDSKAIKEYFKKRYNAELVEIRTF